MPGIVSFQTDRCKGCELCALVCPTKIIVMDEQSTNRKGYHPAVIKAENMAKCIGCANCARMCPDSVITVERV